jgi:hypothetical protein
MVLIMMMVVGVVLMVVDHCGGDGIDDGGCGSR